MDLVQFLRDRLDEDAAAARATTERQPYDEWDAVGAGDDSDSRLSHWEVVKIARPHATPAAKSIAEHIARHNPARVLVEVEVKRKLLKVHRPYVDEPDQACLGCAGGIMWQECPVLRLIALPYAGHPDYQEEWRP